MRSQEYNAISVKHKFLLILMSLTGAGIILFATSQYGAGISPDSVGYIATARHLIDGIGFITYNNTPLLAQPPLYPAVLGVVGFVFRIDPLISANFVSAIFFGLTLYISGLLFLKNLPPFLAFLGTASLIVSLPLIKVSFQAWSEPPFIFFVTLYLFALLKYLEKKNVKLLLLLSFSVMLACLSRYIGVVLVLTGIISILIIQHTNLKTKLLHAFTFAFVSTLPIGIWVGRNYLLSKTFFGPRSPSSHSLLYNLSHIFNTLARWYLPIQITDSHPIFIFLSLIVCFLIGIFFVLAKTPLATPFKQARPFTIFLLLLIFGYSGFLIISSTTTHYDSIGDRLLSPIAVPTNLLLFFIIEKLFKRMIAHLPKKPVKLLLTAGIALWLGYPTTGTAIYTIRQFHQGSEYSTKSWKNSQTIQYVRENNLSDYPIYSNGTDVIYLFLNKNVRQIPLKLSGADTIAKSMFSENTFPQENKACLIWFNQLTWRAYLLTPEELLSVTHLEQRIQLDDGAIYVVSRK